jgi:hypothetical protein
LSNLFDITNRNSPQSGVSRDQQVSRRQHDYVDQQVLDRPYFQSVRQADHRLRPVGGEADVHLIGGLADDRQLASRTVDPGELRAHVGGRLICDDARDRHGEGAGASGAPADVDLLVPVSVELDPTLLGSDTAEVAFRPEGQSGEVALHRSSSRRKQDSGLQPEAQVLVQAGV